MSFMRFLTAILGLVFCSGLCAQEMDCHVQVNANQIEGTNKDKFNTLASNLTEFINTRKWTDAVFQEEERIECNFILTIDETGSGDSYSGNLQIQASRPVFNSSYSTTLFNFKDENLTFTFSEYGEHFEFNENSYDDNLTSIIGFYVNIILGLNFDSYSRHGGSQYFDKAETIANLARSSDDPGWKAFESDRNRYALISNYQDANLKGLRDLIYEYHRLGLDEMVQNVEKGKSRIYSNLPYLQEMNRAKPFSVTLQLFVESKLDEIVDMFRNSMPNEKKELYEILSSIVPTQTNKLKGLLEE